MPRLYSDEEEEYASRHARFYQGAVKKKKSRQRAVLKRRPPAIPLDQGCATSVSDVATLVEVLAP